MPGAGTDKTKRLGGAAGTGGDPGRAADGREHRVCGARHGQFRPVPAAAGQAAGGMAEPAGAQDGLRARTASSTAPSFMTAWKPRSPTARWCSRPRRGRTIRPSPWSMPPRPRRAMAEPVAAGETVGILFGRERIGLENHEVGARRPHRHLAGQSGVRLAQSGPGGHYRCLRMVQACDLGRAAVFDAGSARRRSASSSFRHSLPRSNANWRRSSSSVRPTSATPCRSICAISSRACSRPSRISARCTASSRRSPRAARGRRAAGLLNGDEAALLRTLLAEHGQGRVPNERGPVRGLARLLRRNPTDAERTFWDAMMKDRRFVGLGFKRQVPVGPHVTDIVSFPLQAVIELVPADETETAREHARRTPRLAHRARLSRDGCVDGGGRARCLRARSTVSPQIADRQPFSVLSCAAVPARRNPRSLPTARKRMPRLAQATARSALAQ